MISYYSQANLWGCCVLKSQWYIQSPGTSADHSYFLNMCQIYDTWDGCLCVLHSLSLWHNKTGCWRNFTFVFKTCLSLFQSNHITMSSPFFSDFWSWASQFITKYVRCNHETLIHQSLPSFWEKCEWCLKLDAFTSRETRDVMEKNW